MKKMNNKLVKLHSLSENDKALNKKQKKSYL